MNDNFKWVIIDKQTVPIKLHPRCDSEMVEPKYESFILKVLARGSRVIITGRKRLDT